MIIKEFHNWSELDRAGLIYLLDYFINPEEYFKKMTVKYNNETFSKEDLADWANSRARKIKEQLESQEIVIVNTND